jgi:hypothetical protein
MTTHDHMTNTSGRTRSVLAGIGIAVACAVACSLPLIAAGGLAAGVGAFLAGGEAIALGVVALVGVLVAAALWVRRRRAAAMTARDAGCGCGGGC